MVGLPAVRRGEHLCVLVDDSAAAFAVANTFLGEGAALGDRPLFLPGPVVAERYAAVSDATAVLEGFEASAAEAVADGFGGLRVAADVTALVAAAATRESYFRYEVAAERLIRESGRLTGLCIAVRSELSAEAAADLCALHAVSVPASPVCTRWDWERAAHRLVGEIDIDAATQLSRVTGYLLAANVRRIDVAYCSYLDHHGLRALSRAARDAGVTVELCSLSPVQRRVFELLALPHLAAAG